MKFSDLVGDITVNNTHLQRFVRAWYDPTDIVCVVGIPRNRSGAGRGVLSYTLTAVDLDSSSNTDIFSASQSPDGMQFNCYITVFPMIEDNNVTPRSRGTKKDIKAITGTFADLDIKPGGFTSKEQVNEFLASLDLQPTIVVDNGQAGGIHAYWRFGWGETTEDEEILKRWWAYLQEKAPEGVMIDRLVDKTRISRMPSAIRWGKDGEKDDTVKVITADGPRYHIADLSTVSAGAYERRKRKISETREAQATARMQASSVAKNAYSTITGDTYTGWGATFMIMKIEEWVNENWDWSDILEPMGWKMRRELPDGQGREWARPGQDARSATTDFVHDTGEISNVMSLFSMSPDTGLDDLKEAEIYLTKYTVLKRLHYSDDEKAMIEDLKNKIGKS